MDQSGTYDAGRLRNVFPSDEEIIQVMEDVDREGMVLGSKEWRR